MTCDYLSKDGSSFFSQRIFFPLHQNPWEIPAACYPKNFFFKPSLDFHLHHCSVNCPIPALPVGRVYRVWKRKEQLLRLTITWKSYLAHGTYDTSFVLIENISLGVVTPLFSLNFIKSMCVCCTFEYYLIPQYQCYLGCWKLCILHFQMTVLRLNILPQ